MPIIPKPNRAGAAPYKIISSISVSEAKAQANGIRVYDAGVVNDRRSSEVFEWSKCLEKEGSALKLANFIPVSPPQPTVMIICVRVPATTLNEFVCNGV